MLKDHLTLWTGPLRCRLRRRDHRRMASEIVATKDMAAIERLAAELSSVNYDKFTQNFDGWLVETVRRFEEYGLFRPRQGARLLDVGCGAGQTLLVAEKVGYSTTGLDVPGEESFERALRILGLESVDHRIEPFEPLPAFPNPFDVVTIFMTTFNKLPDGTPWHCDHWGFFLRDLHRHLAPDARVIVKFNVNKMIARHYPPDVWKLVRDCDLYGVARFRDSWVLRRSSRPISNLPVPDVPGKGRHQREEEAQQGLPVGRPDAQGGQQMVAGSSDVP